MDAPTIKRQLKIKTGALQRLAKENRLYAAEIRVLEIRRENFIKDNRGEWDVKNVGKLIEESKKMVEDTNRRMWKAASDLETLVTSAKATLPGDDEDVLKAEEVLASVNASR